MHAGSVRWGGAYGHSWFIDPEARTSAVLLTNTTFEGMIGPLRDEMERAVCGA
jgi:CubicO group peptidase (beta-lactamase class C family)